MPFFYALKKDKKYKNLHPLLEDIIELMKQSLDEQARIGQMAARFKETASQVLNAPYPKLSSCASIKLAAPSSEKKAKETVPVFGPEINVSESSLQANSIPVESNVSPATPISSTTSESSISTTPEAVEFSFEEASSEILASTSEARKAKKEKKTSASTARVAPIAKAQASTVAAASEEVQEIDRIEADQLAKLDGLRHLKPAEVSGILAEMAESLKKVGVSSSEQKAKASGSSHFKKDISVNGNETPMSIARRGTSYGYKAGTVRTIIKQFVARVKSVVSKK